MKYADKPSVYHTLLWSIRLKGFTYITFLFAFVPILKLNFF